MGLSYLGSAKLLGSEFICLVEFEPLFLHCFPAHILSFPLILVFQSYMELYYGVCDYYIMEFVIILWNTRPWSLLFFFFPQPFSLFVYQLNSFYLTVLKSTYLLFPSVQSVPKFIQCIFHLKYCIFCSKISLWFLYFHLSALIPHIFTHYVYLLP